MSTRLGTDAVREPTVVAAGARTDPVELDVVAAQCCCDRRRDVERWRPGGGLRYHDIGNRGEVVHAELVAAGADHRAEDRSDDRPPTLLRNADGGFYRARHQTTPASMSGDERAVIGCQHERGTVTSPHRDVRVNSVREHQVTDARRRCLSNSDAVHLIEHRPGSPRCSDLALCQVLAADIVGMDITVAALGRNDPQTPFFDGVVDDGRDDRVNQWVRHPLNSLEERRNVEIIIIISERIVVIDITEQLGDSSRRGPRLRVRGS